MLWLARAPGIDGIEDERIDVWKFEPNLVGGKVWWADCPHGATHISTYYDSISIDLCISLFGRYPASGSKISLPWAQYSFPLSS